VSNECNDLSFLLAVPCTVEIKLNVSMDTAPAIAILHMPPHSSRNGNGL